MANEKEKKDIKTESSVGVTGRRFVDKSGVITLNGGMAKEESLKEQGSIELQHSRTTNTPLTMNVVGVEPFEDVRVVVGFYKGWKVIISPTDFFTEEALKSIKEHTLDPAKERGDNVLGTFYRILSIYSGAEIDFIPKEFHPEQNIVIASRVKAMEVVKADMWQATNTITRKGEDGESIEKTEYLLHEGVVVQARVISVAQYYATLEIFGIETRVFLSDLSHTRVDNAKRLVENGQVVNAVLTKVERDEKGNVKDIAASVRLANKNPQTITYESVVENGRYKGRVSWITGKKLDNKKPIVYVVLEQLGGGTVFCNLPENIIPVRGDIVDIVVIKKYENDNHIFGKILHVFKKEFN